ncbi:MAG: DUF5691 domain-containing protein [Bacteroidota bacterium]
MLWQELIKVALMGTERSQLSPPTKEELRRLGIDPALPPPRLVLEGAAYLATMHKGGIRAREWTRPLPEAAPPNDPQRDCSPRAIQVLEQILNDSFPDALGEFVQLLHQHQRQLPAEMLPDLFDQARRNAELWGKLRDCIGTRGHWLLQQNPDWASLRRQPDEALWEYGTRPQRLALLRHWREERPDYGRERVMENWDTEDSKTRIGLIAHFATGLGPADETFLENALDDRRKEVRQKAASLLLQIPASALVQRMQERAVALLDLSHQNGAIDIELQLPDELGPAILRDGIDPKLRSYPGGVKASRLGQILAAIPPRFWEQHFERDAEEVLSIFTDSNWPELTFSALTQATIRHRTPQWMEALVDFWFRHHFESPWQNIELEDLMPQLPRPLFNQLALRGLSLDQALASSNGPVSTLLQHGQQIWEDELTYAFFRKIKEWFQDHPGQYWSTWHFWNILSKAAYLIRPQLWPTLQKAFDQDRVWYEAGAEIDKFMTVLRFRDQMQKSLSSDPK